MPIRFHCPFCNRLLGIAHRKMGSVVECPSCHGKVGVPDPDATAEPRLVPLPSRAPFPLSAPAPAPDIVLTLPQLAALCLGVLLLVGVCFAAGLLVGALR